MPVQSVHAAPSPRLFGYKRGITWLNAVNDRFAGLGAIIVTGTVRDSLYILDTLLNLDAGRSPKCFDMLQLIAARHEQRTPYVRRTGRTVLAFNNTEGKQR